MPIYEYACGQCAHRFDTRQSWSDEALTVCPECTGPIRRVMHPAGVIFKGSGWYINDSRKSNGASEGAAKSDKSDSAKSDKSDAAKTTTEPAKPKVETKTTADT